MPRIKSLQRDRMAPLNKRVYHPYVNDPSFCQRLFEIACFVLILASVPAWLGGVYSIFITGYGTALGLIGLLTFGTRRHTLLFLVMSILFFIFVIVVIILNAVDPVGKNLPFYDDTDFAAGATNGATKRSDLFSRQNSGSCQYTNCTFNLYNVGQLEDGQLRLSYGSGAGLVSFSINDGVVRDNLGRICYISAQTQMQCDYAPQTEEYSQFCIQNGRLTYAGSSQWYSCYTGTGPDAANIYTGNLYGHCSPFMNLTSINSTCGAGSEGNPADTGNGNNVIGGGGAGGIGGGNNGTNSTGTGGAGAAPAGAAATGVFVGSRVYAYIDSGIILAATLLTIVAGLFMLGEIRPAPGTLTHSSTTSTTSGPAGMAGPAYATGPGVGGPSGGATGVPGYGIPAAAATAFAVPAAFAARSTAGPAPFSQPVAASTLPPAATTSLPPGLDLPPVAVLPGSAFPNAAIPAAAATVIATGTGVYDTVYTPGTEVRSPAYITASSYTPMYEKPVVGYE